MSLRAEIPQCCVCYEPFRKNVRLVRPPACGHILCKPCGDVMKNLAQKCPFHCPAPVGMAFESVFVDFGLHDIFSLTEPAEGENEYQMTVASHEFHVTEAETVVRLISEVARSNPQTWISKSTSRNNKGLVFLRVSRLLQKIGKGIEGNDNAKDLLNRLALALADLRDLFDSMADMINKNVSVQNKLQKANESLRADLSFSKAALQAREVWIAGKLSAQQSSHAEREDQLRVDLTALRTKWKEEQACRMAAEEKLKKSENELQEWRSNSVRYRRKYEHEKIQNDDLRKRLKKETLASAYPHLQRSEGHSDDSLEIESQRSEADELELDEEDGAVEFPPPSSSSLMTTSQSSAIRTTEASSSCRTLDGELNTLKEPRLSSSSDLKIDSNAFRQMEKTNSAESLLNIGLVEVEHSKEQSRKPRPPHSAKRPISRVRSSSQTSARESRESTSGLNSGPKARDKERHHSSNPSIDPDLLDMFPDLAHDLEALDSSKERTREKRPRSVRSTRAAGVPTNPLATRQTLQGLHGRERKKQRLTMGVGDDD